MKGPVETKIDDYFRDNPELNAQRSFVQEVIMRLRQDTDNTDLMEILYRSKIDRNIIGYLLIQGVPEAEMDGYLHELSATALQVEFSFMENADTYLRQSNLTNKIIYMEAARKFTPQQFEQYIAAGNSEDVREKMAAKLTKEEIIKILQDVNVLFENFQLDDALIKYFLPVYQAMLADPAYNRNEEYTQAERISSSIVFNLVSLPMNEKCQQSGIDMRIPTRVQKSIQLAEGNGELIRAFAPNYVAFMQHLAERLANLSQNDLTQLQQNKSDTQVERPPRAMFDKSLPVSPIVYKTPVEHTEAVIDSLYKLMGDNKKLSPKVANALVDQIQGIYSDIDKKMRDDVISEDDGKRLLQKLQDVALKLAGTSVNTEKEDSSQNLKDMQESRKSLFANRRVSRTITPDPSPHEASYVKALTAVVKDIHAKLEAMSDEKKIGRFM